MKRFMNISRIAVASVLLLFISCTPKHREMKPAVPSIIVSGVEHVDSWPENGGLQQGSLHSEFDSVKYIRLETNDKCMIGEISQILRMGDSLLVVDQYVAKSMVVFDLNGNYCYNIGGQGRGPGEYNEIGYVHVADDGNIYVADRGAGKILTYAKDGHFVKESLLNAGAPQAFVVLKDSILLGSYSGYRVNAPYRLAWMNLNQVGDTLNTAFPYMTTRRYVAGEFLRGKDNEVLFHYPLNDTVYAVTDAKIEPYLSMGFYEEDELRSFIKDTEDLDDEDYKKVLYTSEEITNHIELFRCDNHWVVYSQKGSYAYISFIDKGRRDYIKSDVNKKKLYVPDNFSTSWHDWIIGYVNYDALDYLNKEQREDFLKSLSEACGSEITLDSLEQSNPVITMYHLKSR